MGSTLKLQLIFIITVMGCHFLLTRIQFQIFYEAVILSAILCLQNRNWKIRCHFVWLKNIWTPNSISRICSLQNRYVLTLRHKDFDVFIWIKAGPIAIWAVLPRWLVCKQTFYSLQCVDPVLMIDKST